MRGRQGKREVQPWKDRLWGSSWRQRGLFRWPPLWRYDRRATTSAGTNSRKPTMAAPTYVRLGLGLELALGHDEVRLLSVPFSLSLYTSGLQCHNSALVSPLLSLPNEVNFNPRAYHVIYTLSSSYPLLINYLKSKLIQLKNLYSRRKNYRYIYFFN